jgi:predicted DNA-binding helix-hairpin-helix protein
LGREVPAIVLIQRTPDAYEKLQILGGMPAADDLLSPALYGQGKDDFRLPYSGHKKNPLPGVYRASLPNGKFINLMRVMFTDFCMMDCAYCPNSVYVPRKRYAFKREELAQTFMELAQRHTVNGLFLSSGIAGSGSQTTEKLIDVVELVRRKYGFRGYIHMKVMPGTEYQYVEAAHRLGTRLSVNIETPQPEMMRRISPHKDLQKDILDPMKWIDQLTREKTGGAVGQATQFVVGAADESDQQIFQRIDQMYTDWNLKRVYYAPFRPARHTPMEEHPPVPSRREHRLYQMDWLRRVYQFSHDEISLAFDRRGFLSLEHDPKTVIAVENLDSFPVDVNAATREQLLRVPGVGPTSADQIIENRQRHTIDNWRDLQAMGVVRKRAWPFLIFSGHRPPRAKQLRLDLFNESAGFGGRETFNSSANSRPAPSPAPVAGVAPCGPAASCAGCPMYGAPGHPGAAT